MKRLILGLVCACCCLSGCELLEHNKRAKSGDLAHDHEHEQTEETDSVGAVKSPPPKGFFHGTRLPGALSSDARDIERSLGVP
ncbi:hypothetical protein [Singulisphaera acidiphila]|nr:hypothetical protein [Singulisphaera acidiphila]